MGKFILRRAICTGLVVMGLSATALAAQTLSTGLGQAWPNAQDVSASTRWHVYVFANNGIRYVQVNDQNGNVRGAFATANGQFIVLPMGRDAQRISTPQQRATLSSATVAPISAPETLYNDDSFKLTVTSLSDGSVMFTAAPTTTTSAVAPCTSNDPEDCNTHLN
jgi:hypothetical protein